MSILTQLRFRVRRALGLQPTLKGFATIDARSPSWQVSPADQLRQQRADALDQLSRLHLATLLTNAARERKLRITFETVHGATGAVLVRLDGEPVLHIQTRVVDP